MKVLPHPGTAGALSLLLPGTGQFYISRPGAGIYFFSMALIMWAITFGLLGWIIHILAALHAYSYGTQDQHEATQYLGQNRIR